MHIKAKKFPHKAQIFSLIRISIYCFCKTNQMLKCTIYIKKNSLFKLTSCRQKFKWLFCSETPVLNAGFNINFIPESFNTNISHQLFD